MARLSGRSCKAKGTTGEREFLDALSKALGKPVKLERNLSQTRKGGADCIQLPGYAIEIKRQEELSVGSWWTQAKNQATRLDAVPVLSYRQNRKPWIVMIPVSVLLPDYPGAETALISIEVLANILLKDQKILDFLNEAQD